MKIKLMIAAALAAVQIPVIVSAQKPDVGLLTDTYGEISVTYAVMQNGEVIESGKSGVFAKELNTALTENTMYGIGSVSKMYTTAAAMKLAELGKIDIDKPVYQYMPEFTMADERYKNITVRMLMNHSSGLSGTALRNSFLFDDKDKYAHDNLLKALSEQKLKADPGAFSVYCNDGFTLLELLIEKISGMDYTRFLNEYFFNPLGLEDTKTSQDEFNTDRLAKTYIPSIPYFLPQDTVGIVGTGGIYSTAEELCRFGEVLMGKHPEILSEKSAEQMRAPEYKNGIWLDDGENSVNYGLGWDAVEKYPFSRYGISAQAKGGDTLLYHSELICIPEYDLTAAVLSSGGTSTYNEIFANEILENVLLEQGKINSPFEDINVEPAVQADMPKEFCGYSGLYAASIAQTRVTVSEDGTLTTEDGQKYIYTGDGKFKSSDGSVSLYFKDEINGKTYLILEAVMTLPGLGQTVQKAYNAQKVDDNPLNEAVMKIWDNRNGKKYYIVNEKYTSQLLLASNPSLITVNDGYAAGCKIVDENNAVNEIQIPISSGRDTNSVEFFSKNGSEYCKIGTLEMISEDNIPELYDGTPSICTIQQSGYVRYYKVPDSLIGRKISVVHDDSSAVLIYDKDSICIADSVVREEDNFMLPENGIIAFAGDIGDVFSIEIMG